MRAFGSRAPVDAGPASLSSEDPHVPKGRIVTREMVIFGVNIRFGGDEQHFWRMWVRAQDRLTPHDDQLIVIGDHGSGADDVLELSDVHRSLPFAASRQSDQRSRAARTPANGDA